MSCIVDTLESGIWRESEFTNFSMKIDRKNSEILSTLATIRNSTKADVITYLLKKEAKEIIKQNTLFNNILSEGIK